MSENARAQVTIVVSGQAQGLQEALKQAQSSLQGFGSAASRTSEQVGTKLTEAEAKAGREGQSMGRQMRVTAEAVGVLGAESSESILKIQGLSRSLGEMKEAYGGLSGAILGGIGAMAAFSAVDFLKESVQEAAAGEASWARLTAAYKNNAAGLQQVKATIGDTRDTWEKLGFTQAQVADMAARARGMGIDPTKVLGDPSALADVAKVLGTDIPSALDAISKPRGGMQILSRLGLSREQIRQYTHQLQFMTAAQRLPFIEQLVEQSAFAGQGLAAADTATGKYKAFHTALADLREEVGTALLPALTQLVTALTGLLQGAEAISKPFGGLANVLKVLFIPMLAGGLFLFTNLRGVMTSLVNLLLGRLVGAFSQTAESLADADDAAKNLAADIDAIPETRRTTAIFDSVAAAALKDAYKANIFSIPQHWQTTAEFVPAALPAMGPVPVQAEITSWTEVPVPQPPGVTGTISSWHEAVLPMPAPVTGTVSTWHEAAAHAVTTTGTVTRWTEAAVPIPQTVGFIVDWLEAPADAPLATGIISGWKDAAHVSIPAVSQTGTITAWHDVARVPVPAVRQTGTLTAWTDVPHVKVPAVTRIGTITAWVNAAHVRLPEVDKTGTLTVTEIKPAKGLILDVTDLHLKPGVGLPPEPLTVKSLTLAPGVGLPEEPITINRFNLASGLHLPSQSVTVSSVPLAKGVGLPPEPVTISRFDVAKGVAIPAQSVSVSDLKPTGTLTITGADAEVNLIASKNVTEEVKRVRLQLLDDLGYLRVPAVPVVGPTEDPSVTSTRATMETDLNKGGPLTVKVKPLFVGVGTAATFGAAFAISDAIFNGAVTFDKVSMPNMPKVTWSAADQKQLDTLIKKYDAPIKVHVEGGKLDNIGAIGGALVSKLDDPSRTLLKQQIDALQGQKQAAQDYANALADAKKHPIPVDVHFDAGEMAKMVGEIALGTLIANILTPLLNPKNIVNFIKGGGTAISSYLWGKGPGKLFAPFAAGEGAPSAEAGLINELMGKAGMGTQSVLDAAEALLKGGKGGGFGGAIAGDIAGSIEADMPAAMEGVAGGIEAGVGLKIGGAMLGGLADIAPMIATGAVDLGAVVFSGIAEGVTGGLATPLVAALLGGLGAVTLGVFTHGFGLLGKDGKKEADKLKSVFNPADILKNVTGAVGGTVKNVGGMLGSIGGSIVSAIVNGVKGALGGLSSLGSLIVTTLENAIKAALHVPGTPGSPTAGGGTQIMGRYWSKGSYESPDTDPRKPPSYDKSKYYATYYQPDKSKPGHWIIIPRPGSGAGSSGSGGGGGTWTSAAISPAAQRAFSGLVQTQIAPLVRSFHPPTIARTAAPVSQPVTVHATFNISGAQDPVAISRQINHALADFVGGARASRRLYG